VLRQVLSAVRIGLALAVLVATASASAAEPIEAVWKPQRITFVYSGHTTHYTCHTLEQKLKLVLKTLGAHEDMAIDRTSCSDFTGPRLHVEFRSPVAASIENIRLITTYDAEEVLAARLKNQTLPSAEDLPRFSAVYQEVSFARDRQLKMKAADCEFADHVRRQILPTVDAQVVTNRIFCTPGYPNITPPRLVVSVLLPVQASMASTR
jgi:hypothetical protein